MSPIIVIVSIGSGDPDMLNKKTVDELKNAGSLFLRTGRHPLVSWLRDESICFQTLDFIYDESDDFDCLNQKVASFLFNQASVSKIVYAVPDASTDHTVRSLLSLAPDKDCVKVIPGVGFYDLFTSASLSFYPEAPLTVSSACDLLVDGYFDPNHSLLVTELDNPNMAGDIKILLSQILEDEQTVILIRAYEKPVRIPLYELDRQTDIDHRSAVLVPASGFMKRSRYVLRDLALIMDTLRSADGCPWDRIQTHETLRSYLVEEAWECVEAIDQNDPNHLCEELGDLMFQIIFHSSIGKAYDEFTLNDVVSGICAKMLRRHPHVFSDRNCSDAESVRNAWEQIKQEETGHTSVIESLDDVSPGLPAIIYASKLLKKASRANNVKRTTSDILTEIVNVVYNISDPPDERSLGRLLLLCTELCFCCGIDGELILHQAADRMKKDFKLAQSKALHDNISFET